MVICLLWLHHMLWYVCHMRLLWVTHYGMSHGMGYHIVRMYGTWYLLMLNNYEVQPYHKLFLANCYSSYCLQLFLIHRLCGYLLWRRNEKIFVFFAVDSFSVWNGLWCSTQFDNACESKPYYCWWNVFDICAIAPDCNLLY